MGTKSTAAPAKVAVPKFGLAEKMAKERVEALVRAVNQQAATRITEIQTAMQNSPEAEKHRGEIAKLNMAVNDLYAKINELKRKFNERMGEEVAKVQRQAMDMEQRARSEYQSVMYAIYEEQLTPELKKQINRLPSILQIAEKGADAMRLLGQATA